MEPSGFMAFFCRKRMKTRGLRFCWLDAGDVFYTPENMVSQNCLFCLLGCGSFREFVNQKWVVLVSWVVVHFESLRCIFACLPFLFF